ncbi:CHASE3 domain-containing protein, partial [Pseudomonas sp. CrR14]|nr:CHASE3 domain-containing protein [Pseudomonas sp. CrR14]
MTNTTSIDENSFKRILRRNVALPLGVGVVSAVFFVVLISYLLNVLGWVQHTDRVLNNANEGLKLSIDQETGFRGYLLSGDVRFLQPFEVAKPRIKAEMEILSELVADNTAQIDRLRTISALQEEWNEFAQAAIIAKRDGGNFLDAVRDGRGKQLTDAIRYEYAEFITQEQRLRKERNDDASNTATLTIG